jgi:cellulose biosynthesis protein BcsQ
MVKEASGSGFDYILFDLPASYDFYTRNVLLLAHQIIPVVQCEEFGIEKFGLLLRDLKVLKEDFEGTFKTDFAVANMVDKNKALHREFLTIFDDTSFEHFACPASSEILNAAANHKVIQEYRPKNVCVPIFDKMASLLYSRKEF